jgi:hypothetical protein
MVAMKTATMVRERTEGMDTESRKSRNENRSYMINPARRVQAAICSKVPISSPGVHIRRMFAATASGLT